MAAGSKFPLLLLPHKETLRAIRVMDLDHILRFSLISKKCKDLVATFKIKGKYSRVNIYENISFHITIDSTRMCVRFYTEPDMYWGVGTKKRLTAPLSVTVEVRSIYKCSGTTSKWQKKDFTMKNWINHLHDFFDHRKIDDIRFIRGSPHFDIDDIRKIFENPTKVTIEDTSCFTFNLMILQKYFSVEKLYINTSNFQNSKIPESILTQNFLALNIEVTGENKMSLEELLLMNSKMIIVDSFSPKDFNKFIKLWQQGSNPHLEYLRINGIEDEEARDPETVMKGIKYRKKVFESAELNETEMLDIYRKDGTEATIGFHGSIWTMHVSMDHCIFLL